MHLQLLQLLLQLLKMLLSLLKLQLHLLKQLQPLRRRQLLSLLQPLLQVLKLPMLLPKLQLHLKQVLLLSKRLHLQLLLLHLLQQLLVQLLLLLKLRLYLLKELCVFEIDQSYPRPKTLGRRIHCTYRLKQSPCNNHRLRAYPAPRLQRAAGVHIHPRPPFVPALDRPRAGQHATS